MHSILDTFKNYVYNMYDQTYIHIKDINTYYYKNSFIDYIWTYFLIEDITYTVIDAYGPNYHEPKYATLNTFNKMSTYTNNKKSIIQKITI